MSPRGRWKPPGKFARKVGKVLPKGSPPYRAALSTYEWWRKKTR